MKLNLNFELDYHTFRLAKEYFEDNGLKDSLE